jgi:hypothetical protein
MVKPCCHFPAHMALDPKPAAWGTIHAPRK